jgi:transcriptional regulator with XRE-family HTH domain
MTPLAQSLDRLGWSAKELARRIGYSGEAVNRWHAGTSSRGKPCEPPDAVMAWLGQIERAIAKIPPPPR